MHKSRLSHGVRQGGVVALVLAATLLAACATEKPSGVMEAVTVPISDLNIIRSKIPPALLVAHDDPYETPEDLSCAVLDEEISDLDYALGPNGEEKKNGTTNGEAANGQEADPENKESLVEKGTEKAGDAAVDALRRTAEGLVPFREWVRKLSGAERHSQLVADAVAAGLIRRAYLKGIKVGKKCK